MSVPEPGAWAMMLLGVGAIGGLQRRRRTLPLAAAVV
jgi:MYXO-CTERM domain-containing protein